MSRLKLLAALLAAALFVSIAAAPAQASGFRVLTAGYYPAYYAGPMVQTVSYTGYGYGGYGYGGGMAAYAGGYGYGDYGIPYWGGPAVYYSPYATIYPPRYHNPLSPVMPIYSSTYYTPTNYTVDYAPYVLKAAPNIMLSPVYAAGAYGSYYGAYGYHACGYCGY